MLLPVLGLDGDEETADAAIALGCAVQLLNIARDVRSDLIDRKRIYLPLADAARCGLSEVDLETTIRAGGPASPGFKKLIRLQGRRASALLRKAETSLPRMTRLQALLVGVLIELHHELYRSLEERGFDCLPAYTGGEAEGSASAGASGEDAKRVRVSTSRKISITASTALSVLFRGPAGHYQHLRSSRLVRGRAAAPQMAVCHSSAAQPPAQSAVRPNALSPARATGPPLMKVSSDGTAPSWASLSEQLPSLSTKQPHVLDTVLTTSASAPEGLTLFRERHGWCPYSEKVWLALELKGIDYSTVLIDNTGGGRPGWYRGQTPQIQWADGRSQGESMDIVKALDKEYPETRALYPPPGVSMSDVASMITAFRSAFPSNAKPSSRAAYLFTYSGPLPRSDFEKALDATEKLLGKHDDGPFFVGAELSAADISWAPFLERYAAQASDARPSLRYTLRCPFRAACASFLFIRAVANSARLVPQLPCLHDGLMPRGDAARWPNLAAWYEAMDEIPEYAHASHSAPAQHASTMPRIVH